MALKTVVYLDKDLKISPRKLRLLVNEVKRLNPFETVKRLQFVNTKAARMLKLAINNAIADAKNNYHLNPDSLKFKEIRVDEGTKIKRMDRSHGYRFNRGIIIKRHSRLIISLTGEETNYGAKS
ncbi:MAG TPA: uL22 family ribosomal protein [Candidatus Woesebacteria bacterium]|nr:uL22 family ribosomal protein [Candidatus Woesebacteria bacterium]HRT39802.1 uL22 family ribosomal protein [Candidatus Woesebacteria bacterium]